MSHSRRLSYLVQAIETYKNTYPIAMVAQHAVNVVKKVIPHCDGKLLHFIMGQLEELQMITPDYHQITVMTLPFIKIYTKVLQRIHTSLQEGDIDATLNYLLSGQKDEEIGLVMINRLIKLQEVAPNFVQENASQQL